MATAIPLAQLKLPDGPSPVSAEQRYWKSFRSPKSHTSTAAWPISHISFPASAGAASQASSSLSLSLAASAKANDLFAVTSGPRIDIYSIRKPEPIKTIGRFDCEAHGGEIRPDGRVLVAGDDSGKMQVFDVGSGSRPLVLKTWHVHKQPVWLTKWSPREPTTLMSTSDDKTVRLWDLPSSEPTRVFAGHSDYVRCGAFLPAAAGGSGNMLVSGSYDETVRIWDARTAGDAVLTFKHTDPVEEVLPLPSGTTLLAAAGNVISVLDLVAAKPLQLITNHQKTVTSLCLASHGRRVLSGSLDGHVKVFETAGWNVVAGAKYPSPILSLSVITAGAGQEDRHLAVGMQSGVLSIRTRLAGAAADKARRRATEMAAHEQGDLRALGRIDRAKTKRSKHARARRTMAQVAETVDAVIPYEAGGGTVGQKRRARSKQNPWQRLFREQRYGAALDLVLDQSDVHYSPVDALTVFMALRHRSALREALEGRDEHLVMPVLRWVGKHISDPRYAPVCVDTALHLLDLYGEFVGASAQLADAFQLLCGRVSSEVEKAQLAMLTNGMLESLMVGSYNTI